ncbi:MAG: glycosyltransferase family 2 protein, partial [Candidatus Eremiobacteraeota bacterium]|nr:glycosyltransferase family 2 protein [Candidatus Eremiobacteraeota bacterium]
MRRSRSTGQGAARRRAVQQAGRSGAARPWRVSAPRPHRRQAAQALARDVVRTALQAYGATEHRCGQTARARVARRLDAGGYRGARTRDAGRPHGVARDGRRTFAVVRARCRRVQAHGARSACRRSGGRAAGSGRRIVTVPEASVVIATRDRAAALRACLAALADQTAAGRFEVIVVDNGSSDDTAGVVAAAGPLATRVFVADPNRGKARNAGIAKARAPLVIFCDDDTLAPHGFVAAHLAAHGGASDRVV